MPDAMRKSQLRRSMCNIAECDPRLSAINQLKMTTTVVRIAVAKFGSTLDTPSFASSAVAAAKIAERRDHTNQVITVTLQGITIVSIQRRSWLLAGKL